jgi:phospho-N-acetylmuramoyl-pentapeptide-transferase
VNIWTLTVTVVIALIVAYTIGHPLIPVLRRLKFGQTILDIGPKWHEKKQGTPTMGGFMFIAGTTAAFAVGLFMLWQGDFVRFDTFGSMRFFNAVSGFVMALCFAFMGFVDDWIKVRKKQNAGLSVNQKLLMQALIVSAYFTSRVIAGDSGTSVFIPIIEQTLQLGVFYYIVMGLGIIYIVNAVNLTDGVDGLCGSVTVVYCSAFMVICGLLGSHELSVLAAATAGGCIGFLIWNFNPAKVFMGDTGSLFLGGLVCAIGMGGAGNGTEIIMILAAAVYIWEALTVMIQTTYFKLTGGKRLFKMTPIHHSFEMRGWKENKIVVVFSAVGAVFGLIGILLVYSYAPAIL